MILNKSSSDDDEEEAVLSSTLILLHFAIDKNFAEEIQFIISTEHFSFYFTSFSLGSELNLFSMGWNEWKQEEVVDSWSGLWDGALPSVNS